MSSFAWLFSAPKNNVYDVYADLRETDAGVHVEPELNMALITRYADAEQAYRQKSIYSSDTFAQAPASIYNRDDPSEVRFAEHLQNFLLFLDPPKHTRLRNLVRRAFTPDAINAMAHAVSTASDEILADFQPGDEVEFVSQIADRLPTYVIATMIGVPPSDRPDIRRWTEAAVRVMDPAVQGDERSAVIREACGLLDYIYDHIERRRSSASQPAEDLLTLLLDAKEGNDSLRLEELVTLVVTILAAGNSTTTDLLGNAIVQLAENPDASANLSADPSLMSGAVEEILRLEPSLPMVMRKIVGESVNLGGHTLQPGTFVWICNGSANRDPRRFDDPDRLDICRENNRHLSFGSGIHFCLGSPLARLEARTMLEKFLARFPETTLLSDPTAMYHTNFVTRSLKELPIKLA